MRVYATQEVIELLERDIFNWNVYPRFSELKNEFGPVMEYVPIPKGEAFKVAHLTVTAVAVNHIVPTVGLIVSDGKSTVAFSSDTSETDEFWTVINRVPRIDALLIEASFPNSMANLAEVSRHYTPASLQRDLRKLNHNGLDILAVHIKPAYRQMVIDELEALNIPKLGVMESGRTYELVGRSKVQSRTKRTESSFIQKDVGVWTFDFGLCLVDRIKLSLPMFAFNLVQQHASAGKKFFNARGPVFAIAPGH